MSYPSVFFKLSWGGDVYSEEIFSNSLSIAHTSPVGSQFDRPTNIQAITEAMADKIETYWNNSSNGIHRKATLRWVKLATLDEEGKYIGEAGLFEYDSPLPGPLDASTQPMPQLTLVQSLVTDNKRGLAAQGRIYPPLNIWSVGSNGRIDVGTTQTQATATASLIRDVNEVAEELLGGAEVVVASKLREGAFHVVRGVRVGDVVDTQRSRRSNFKETYSPVAPIVLPV